VAWPIDPLTVEVCLQLNADLTSSPTGYAFATDITTYTFDRDGDSSIVINRGRTDEMSQDQPSSCNLTVNNTDGRFTPRNPLGAYYGGLRRNAPLRVRVNPGTGLVTRYVGFVSEWPPRWDLAEKDHYVPVVANGILRRLGQGQSPLKSAMFRAHKASAPQAWWPLEDGQLASAGASGLDGGTPTFQIVLPAKFGATPIGASGAASGADFSAGGSLVAPTGQTLAAAPNGWEWECVVAFSQLPTISLGQVCSIIHSNSSGPAALMGIGITNSAGTLLWCNYIRDAGGSGTSAVLSFAPVLAGRTYHLRGVGHQDGAGLRFTAYIDGAFTFDDGFNGTLMMPTTISLNVQNDPTLPTTVANPSFLSSLAFWAPFRASPTTYLAGNGYAGELAHVRFSRLCTEEQIPADVDPQSTELMGPQDTKTLLELLRECEAADEALMLDQTDGRLAFNPRVTRENKAVAFTLDYAAGHVSSPLEPTDDDQRIRNDITVTRTGGSKAQLIDQSGPVGIDAVGRYDEGVELNLFTDDQPYNHAGWRLNLGTVDGLRFPTVTVNLRANNSLTAAIVAITDIIGSRIKITNLPDVVSFDDVDLIIEGYTEQISQKNWIITFNCAPYRPYKAFVLANTTSDTSEFLGRLDADTLTLDTAVNASVTSYLVRSIPLFTTVADDFPLDAFIGGERITATNCVSSVSDTWTRTVANGWGNSDTGQTYSLVAPSTDYSVNGTQGLQSNSAVNTTRAAALGVSLTDVDLYLDVGHTLGVAPTGGTLTAFVDVRLSGGGSTSYRLNITWGTGAGTNDVQIEVDRFPGNIAVVGPVAVPNRSGANSVTVRLQVIGSLVRVKGYIPGTAEPDTWLLSATDTNVTAAGDIRMASNRNTGNTNSPTVFFFDNLNVIYPQLWTVTRSVNGVVTTHAAGDALQIAEPKVLAL